ncbi:isocitrate dehydrogenase subunit gamma, mitochondrial [Trichonephila clavipes]|nr:isocitrate dehydrogenase subunit gamma, mitochondrial [Trichonephila clavipes]
MFVSRISPCSLYVRGKQICPLLFGNYKSQNLLADGSRTIYRGNVDQFKAKYGGRFMVSMLPGDGIGPEMMGHVKEIFRLGGVPVDFEEVHLDSTVQHIDNVEEAITSIKRNGVAIKDNLVALHFKYDQARRRFVEWAQNEIAVVPDFHKRILFSDEAHFWLNGYVNKQNCCIWSEANPQVYVETPLHPEKLTVWCALWAGGIIGPYFFKNDEGHNVTVNGDRYRAMITNFFIPELNNHDV